MNRTFEAFPFDGLNTDCLGNYLAGLGLLAATAQRWPGIRGCWRDGRFCLLSYPLFEAKEVGDFLLAEWKPTNYQRWWHDAQLSKSPQRMWHERNERNPSEVRQLDAHIVVLGRNCFNPIFGSGGNIGRRELEKVWKSC